MIANPRLLVWLTALIAALLAPAGAKNAIPDLTDGGLPDSSHDWNLGPTGARGWIWGWKLETVDSRQILITSVEAGSPADGILQKGDVILGVRDRIFTEDARKSFARAITEAETSVADGKLHLIRWRAGRTESVTVTLPVFGSYHDASPWDCKKSEKIVEAGCAHIVANMKGGIDGKINVLALLATGDAKYEKLIRRYVHKLAPPDLDLKMAPTTSMASWHWGYTNLLLTEYYLATGDSEVLPAIRKYTVSIAQGQSGVGTWGHAMAWPQWNDGKRHGRLGGYGALNQAGLVCQLSLVLGVKCGVDEPVVHAAIERGNTFFGFYIGKGSIPYGDHRPDATSHDDNGKNSIAAVLFDAQGHTAGARFFSRMTVASYGERERGHTGNYFSYLWGAAGAVRAGPEAAAAFLKEQRWFYDLNRGHDGRFRYQGGAASTGAEHKYGSWNCTGAFLLSYLLPRGELYMTGKDLRTEVALTKDELAGTLAAGRGFDSWEDGVQPYRVLSRAELLTSLTNWSPAVRSRAARVLAEQSGDDPPLGELIERLDGENLTTRYGACQAVAELGARGAPAVRNLQALLWSDDLWLRILASHALASIGAPARVAVPDLLKLVTAADENDPREMKQRYLAFSLFYRGDAAKMKGLLAGSLEGINLEMLRPAVERILVNPNGRARKAVGSLYQQLSYEEVKPLLPAVHRAILEPPPSGIMFANGIRLHGLELFARHGIREGMPLCLDIMDLSSWGKRERVMRGLRILRRYGGSAKGLLPGLHDLERKLISHREARNLGKQIEEVRNTIAAIENGPEVALRSLGD